MNLELKEIDLLIEGLESIEKELAATAFSKSLLTLMLSKPDETQEDLSKKLKNKMEKEGNLETSKKNSIELLKAKIILMKHEKMKEMSKNFQENYSKK